MATSARAGHGTRFALPAALALVALIAFLPLAASAFFLFDDFAVVGIAINTPFHTLLTTGYGFFRPVALTLFRGEALAFGWKWPWAWVTVSAALHVSNVLLTATLYRRVGLPTAAAVAGAALFAVSP